MSILRDEPNPADDWCRIIISDECADCGLVVDDCACDDMTALAELSNEEFYGDEDV